MSTCILVLVLDVLKYFLKKMRTWPVLVLGIYLGYLVYLSTWSTVLDPNPGVNSIIVSIKTIIPTVTKCLINDTGVRNSGMSFCRDMVGESEMTF